MGAPNTTITDDMIRELRESIRNGTPETSDPALFALCTNALAGFEHARAEVARIIADRVNMAPRDPASAVVYSGNEHERVKLLGAAFRAQLRDWLANITQTVRHSDAVQHELVMALLETAAAVRFTRDDRPDDEVEAIVDRATKDALAAIDRQVGK